MAADQTADKSSTDEIVSADCKEHETFICSMPENIHRVESEPCLSTPTNTLCLDSTGIHRTNSSNNIFIEIPAPDGRDDRSLETLSDSDDSVVFCSDPEGIYQLNRIEKPKDLLTEVSDILSSLSDDERFLECIHFSSKNSAVFDEGAKRRTSVDIIFTYNVLNILYSKLKELKAYFEFTQLENSRLRKESHITEAEHTAYQIQLDQLQKTIDDQKREIEAIREEHQSEKENYEKERLVLSNKHETELKSLRKKYENVDNEKNTAVMKYVKNESELIQIRKERENLVKKLKAIESERDEMSKKLRTITSEKVAAGQTLELKKHELNTMLRDMEKLKEELNCKDIKCNWIEENLRKELSRCQEQNANLMSKIDKYEDAIKKYKADSCFDSDNFNSDEENVFTNGSCESPINSNEMNGETGNPVTNEEDFINDRKVLKMKIRQLKEEKLGYEKNLANLRETIDVQNGKLNGMQKELADADSLRSEFTKMHEKLVSSFAEIEELKNVNDDLKQDLESCREREAELLNFTEKLTNKNVNLQSEFAILEAKKLALDADFAPLKERIKKLENHVTVLQKRLGDEAVSFTTEIHCLRSRIEELNKEIESLETRLEEQQAENQSLKFKYSSTIRELTKEVQQYRKSKQMEGNECSSSSDSVCLESRTSSCNSLNEASTSKMELDRQVLIDRIVKFQKLNVKYMEKIEFLEEHVAQLVAEVKKKNRVIQHYVLREQSGVLSSKTFDEHKAEVSKYGGIMASLYSTKCDDTSLSLELSLEINRKLQAVLEDTILKNITLKENVETLGKEIARLAAAADKSKES